MVVVVDVIRKQALKNDRKPSQSESKQMVILHTMKLHWCTMIMGKVPTLFNDVPFASTRLCKFCENVDTTPFFLGKFQLNLRNVICVEWIEKRNAFLRKLKV